MTDCLESYPAFREVFPEGSWEQFLSQRRGVNRTDRENDRPARYAKVTLAQKAAWLATARMVAQADRNLGVVAVKEEPSGAEWERLWSALESANAARGDLGPDQATTTFTAPDRGPVGIAFVSDAHIGAGGVRYDLFKRDMHLIAATDGLYAVFNGDVLENTKAQAKSGNALYHALFASPQEQIAYATQRMRWAKGKWLALSSGNHDAFDGAWAGVDRLPALARDLGCPYFTEAGGTVVVRVGDERYVIAVKHQYTGQSRISTSNSARRMFDEWPEWENVDVVALGHLHSPDVHQVRRKGAQVIYLRGGSYKTHDPWSASKGYQSAYGVPLVVFYGEERKAHAFVDFEAGIRFLVAERARCR